MHVHVMIRDSAAEQVRAAGLMCVAADGRMLFLKRAPGAKDHAETWCFPGGGIEDGEMPVDAARRETLEEFGLVVCGALRLVDTRQGFATYRLDLDRPFTGRLNGEHTDATWLLPTEAPSPLHPGVAATLKHLGLA